MGAPYDACYPANELAVHGVLALQIDTAELLHFRTHVMSAATVLVRASRAGARRWFACSTRSRIGPSGRWCCR